MRRNLAVALATCWIALGGSRAARCADAVFVNGGLGAGSVGIAGTLSLNVVRGDTFYGMRTAAMSEFNIFGPSPSESVTDYGLLWGRVSRSRHGLQYAAAGLGLVRSVERGRITRSEEIWFFDLQLFTQEYERIDRTTLGVPFAAGAILHAGAIGVGIEAFGNLNAARSFVGFALTLQLGKMR